MSPNGQYTQNGPNGTQNQPNEKTPLNIVIVGAGIGGLSLAIFLRQQRHNVTLLEQSRFANEIGAAVHIAPNATGLLKRMGIDAQASGAVLCNQMNVMNPKGETLYQVPVWRSASRWQHPWLLGHRADLHSELKKFATKDDGSGSPVTLRTSSRVSKVSTDGVVTLESGEEIKADVVVGADGVHSRTRSALPGSEGIKTYGSGKSAFRFTMARSRALEDPVTKPLIGLDGCLTMYMGVDRRVIIYPTRDNELLNFNCIHNTKDSEISSENLDSTDWQNTGHMHKLLEVYADFDPALLKLLGKADEDSLKVWELLDMEQLPTWVDGRLALIGDAAHPFTPHQGQGAAQAIEDAASLACVLPLGTPLSEIPARLKIYNECRYDRASSIQEYSRITGKDLGSGPPIDSTKFTNENFGHDAWHYTSQKLREWEWSRNPTASRRMPFGFGPAPSPQRSLQRETTFSTTTIKFRTSRTILEGLFPTPAFKFAQADTNCFATFSVRSLGNLDWLGGRGYSSLELNIHGIQYTKENGESVNGSYVPIVFENLADSIISSREELGLPKVFADLDVTEDANGWSVKAGWMGNEFLNINLTGLSEKSVTNGEENGTPVDSGRFSEHTGRLFYKYIPASTAQGTEARKADVEYAGVIPAGEETQTSKKVKRTLIAEKTAIRFDPLDQRKLPTLHHIVERLAEIPIYEVLETKFTQGTGANDFAAAQKL